MMSPSLILLHRPGSGVSAPLTPPILCWRGSSLETEHYPAAATDRDAADSPALSIRCVPIWLIITLTFLLLFLLYNNFNFKCSEVKYCGGKMPNF